VLPRYRIRLSESTSGFRIMASNSPYARYRTYKAIRVSRAISKENNDDVAVKQELIIYFKKILEDIFLIVLLLSEGQLIYKLRVS